MWEISVLGTDIYHIVLWFIIYSILGGTLESIYMSFCNKRLTNRGFARVPLCPIYGFGFVGAYFIFKPISSHLLLLYVTAAIVATAFEYLVGVTMIRLLGSLWWDYNDKPFNYKGIICLESTLAWGVYAICLFAFLHKAVMMFSDRLDPRVGQYFCSVVAIIYMLDFTAQLMRVLNISAEEQFKKVKDKCLRLKARFY